jgi:hypothetical protein
LGDAIAPMDLRRYTTFGHALRFDRIAAASHAAAGFVTVEELIGLTVLAEGLGARRGRAAPISDAEIRRE